MLKVGDMVIATDYHIIPWRRGELATVVNVRRKGVTVIWWSDNLKFPCVEGEIKKVA